MVRKLFSYLKDAELRNLLVQTRHQRPLAQHLRLHLVHPRAHLLVTLLETRPLHETHFHRALRLLHRVQRVAPLLRHAVHLPPQLLATILRQLRLQTLARTGQFAQLLAAARFLTKKFLQSSIRR